MKELQEQKEIEGEEKKHYLHSLDSQLEVLVSRLGMEGEGNFFLTDFGNANSWNWARLPEHSRTYQKFAKLVARARQDYQWLDWLTFENPELNRGYFEKVGVSTRTGLPWQFDIIELHNLKEKSPEMLAGMPSYTDYAKNLRTLLMTDDVDIANVTAEAEKIQKESMKRSFLEQLQNAPLIGGKNSEEIEIEKVRPEGSETLWNLSFIRHSLATNLFHIYSFDIWQDILSPPQIVEEEKVKLSKELKEKLVSFSDENAAWYILRDLDESFECLHPVHVSRLLIGPFENKYLTNPSFKPLQATSELLKENEQVGLLRFSRNYTYSPNHQEENGKTRQVIYRDNWLDEGIVCPSQYSAQVSRSVQGNKIRIFEFR